MENPFAREIFRNLPDRDVEEIYRNPDLKLPFDPKDLVMFVDRGASDTAESRSRRLRILPYHHRSADLGISTVIHERIPARGTRPSAHNVYVQIDIKGGGFVSPETHESKKHGLQMGELAGSPEAVLQTHSYETASGYDFLGLMDEGMAITTARRAHQLAADGMRTEAVAGLYRIKSLRVEGKEVRLKDFLAEARRQLEALADEAKRQGDEELRREYLAKISDLKSPDGFRPVVEVRLMRSVLRLRDFLDADPGLRQEMLDEACRCLNIEQQTLGFDQRFEAKSPEGRRAWLAFMVGAIGKNLGILHRHGLVHMFLHMGNLTLAGEIVDLDSVQPVVKRGKGGGEGKTGEPFFSKYDGGYAYIDSAVGEHRLPDGRWGIPRCVLKDFRDASFSFRKILKEIPELGGADIRRELAEEMVREYVAGLGSDEPFADIGITRERLEQVLKEVVEIQIANGRRIPPIPTDGDKAAAGQSKD
jgi:hypothetical protein